MCLGLRAGLRGTPCPSSSPPSRRDPVRFRFLPSLCSIAALEPGLGAPEPAVWPDSLQSWDYCRRHARMRPIFMFLASAVPRCAESCVAGEYLSTIQYCVNASGAHVAGCTCQTFFTECCNLTSAGYYSIGGAVGTGVQLPCRAGTYGSATGLNTSACSGTCR